jgi:cell division protein FtsL
MRLASVLPGVLRQRFRGFRVVDIAALVIFLALALTVYAFKTSAGAERTDIADVEQQIRDETRDVQQLRAQVAHLESPDRLETLARANGQSPIGAKQEVTPQALSQVATAGGRP